MAENEYPNGHLLASAAWLQQHLGDPELKIVDARSGKEYAEGHIPGSVVLANGAFRATSGVPDTCTADEFAATVSALGISPSDTVVCYDSGLTGAGRAWWAFSRFGHADVRFLDGGLKYWLASGGPMTTDATPVQPATYAVTAAQDHLHCSLPQAAGGLSGDDVLFWDVRSEGEYTGADPRNNPADRAGHLPKAVHLEWTEMVDSAGLFKPAAEMRALLANKGITPEKEVVAY